MKKQKTLSSLKKGELFRFKGKKKVYIYDGGGKVRGFNYTGYDDISDFHSTKTDRAVDTDFTF
jgi:hypothetical protein